MVAHDLTIRQINLELYEFKTIEEGGESDGN